jgi:hypothetical protein
MTNIPDFNTKHQDSMEYLAIIRGILWDEMAENRI